MKVIREGRILKLSGLPDRVESAVVPTELEIEIRYAGNSACTKAIQLDNYVIPLIVDALMSELPGPVTRQSACDLARELSKTHGDAIFWVYRTSYGSYWVRKDPKPLAEIDGIGLNHVAGYLNGEQF